jgi:glycerol-3-phosphate dehydrogenase
MRRDTRSIADQVFDLVVVGGGISGACVAWDAALRGLRVALLEKYDFGHATSAASGRVIHGGLRHLQRAALRLLRESYRERETLRRIAPHLVRPLPFLIPTYRHPARSKLPLVVAMRVYEALTASATSGHAATADGPGHRVLSKHEALELAPGLPRAGLTGGVLYEELQAELAERLTLAVVGSAAAAGAELANYLEAISLLRDGDRVVGVRVVDRLGGEAFDARGHVVANMTGPWTEELRASLVSDAATLGLRFAKGVHVVVPPLTRDVAVALPGSERVAGSWAGRGGRHIFIMPWRGHSLVGATNTPYEGRPEDARVEEADIEALIAEIAALYPSSPVERGDVVYGFAGLYPIFAGRTGRGGRYDVAVRSRLFDHERRDGIRGIVSAIAVKYTTARRFAEDVVDLVFRKLGHAPPPVKTAHTAVAGGAIPDLEDYVARSVESRSAPLQPEDVRRLVRSYGTNWRALLGYAASDPGWSDRICLRSGTLKAEVLQAVRQEMAVKLSDVVFRRTGLGTLGDPGRECLQSVARIMAGELGWGSERVSNEVDEVRRSFPNVVASRQAANLSDVRVGRQT